LENVFDTFRPEGFHSVTPYLIVDKPLILIEFLKKTFFAAELDCTIDPESGNIANCILQIGDTCFMISQAKHPYKSMQTSFYLYVEDVDMLHRRAIENGAILEFEPADMPYDDRQSGIIDPCGNYWWISKRLVKKGYHE